MEMFMRVHAKFILHYSLILPLIGGKMLLHPMQAFVNENKNLVFDTCLQDVAKPLCIELFFCAQDTGISVRKRVIKILRDICLEQPTFTKITEMCVRMIRRVNDEEGIKVWIHLVNLHLFSLHYLNCFETLLELFSHLYAYFVCINLYCH